MSPLNPTFNVAVRQIAERLIPHGWTTAKDDLGPAGTMATFDAGAPVIWEGECDRTAFDDPDTNIAFRAWHDWAHWRYRLPFTCEGETKAACVQAGHLVQLYGRTPATIMMVAQLFAEVIGMARYYDEIGEFPHDQMAFVRQTRRNWLLTAQSFVQHVNPADACGRMTWQGVDRWSPLSLADGFLDAHANRCNPVIRVQAPSRPCPPKWEDMP